MPISVVGDLVPSPDDRACERRIALHPLADAKEGRARTVLIEQVEHRARHFGVRAIVDGNCDGSGVLRQRRKMCPIGAEQVAARPQSARCKQEMIRHDR